MSARLRGSDASAAVVDLTNDRSSPPAQATSLQMAESGASAGRKRSPRVSESTLGGDSKRARLDRDISAHGAHSVAVEADAAIDSIDLAEDDFEWEDSKLSHALRKQAEDAVKSQSQSKDASLTLANLTCLICMEMPPKDLTATSCGHLFCHRCLMEWLVSSETRWGSRGQQKRSKCPVCRKPLNRSKRSDIIPLLMKQGARAEG